QRTLRLDKKGEGRGSIIMGYVEVKTSGTLRMRSKTYEGPGRKITETTMERVGDSVAHKPVGFMDVYDVSDVEQLLRATLNLPPAVASPLPQLATVPATPLDLALEEYLEEHLEPGERVHWTGQPWSRLVTLDILKWSLLGAAIAVPALVVVSVLFRSADDAAG